MRESWLRARSTPYELLVLLDDAKLTGMQCGMQALGAKNLAQGLTNNVSLHSLNLAWNGLEDPGCTAVAQALHQNMGLKVSSCHAQRTLHLCLLRVSAKRCSV